MLSGSQNKLNAKAKTDRSSKKKGVLDNYFNHWVYIPYMPHHLKDGYKVGTQPDHVTPGSQSGSLITGSDTSRSKVVILTMKEGT